uniref:Nucleic acid-binding, OB-fold protein n=1 Tax=Tanacetum cinerariifolium TaxID=118510 RepID=A0A6L2JBY2_TANCI|nr:nucleic acid-binding, OB-fold protein [Tanacetum cinerariifolium]
MLLDTSLMLEDPFNNEQALEPWTSTWPTKDKLYLSSSSSTQIFDDPNISALKELKSEIKVMDQSKQIMLVDFRQPRAGTLENLLLWARNRQNKNGWNFPTCDEENCNKGVGRKLGGWWCDACKKAVEYPVLRYKLELGIFDETSHVVVVMFGETASELVKCSVDSLAQSYDDYLYDTSGLPAALENIIGTTHTLELKSHTYYEYGTFESYTCWNLISPEVVMESAVSSTIDVVRDTPGSSKKRLCKQPAVATP